MTTECTKSDSDKDLKDMLEIYKIHRTRVVEEDGLINHRVNWLLFAESIILPWWAITTGASVAPGIPADWIRVALPLMGVAVSSVGFALAQSSGKSIGAAHSEIDKITGFYDGLRKTRPEKEKYEIMTRITGDGANNLMGHDFPKLLPKAFQFVLALACVVSISICLWNLFKAAGSPPSQAPVVAVGKPPQPASPSDDQHPK